MSFPWTRPVGRLKVSFIVSSQSFEAFEFSLLASFHQIILTVKAILYRNVCARKRALPIQALVLYDTRTEEMSLLPPGKLYRPYRSGRSQSMKYSEDIRTFCTNLCMATNSSCPILTVCTESTWRLWVSWCQRSSWAASCTPW